MCEFESHVGASYRHVDTDWAVQRRWGACPPSREGRHVGVACYVLPYTARHPPAQADVVAVLRVLAGRTAQFRKRFRHDDAVAITKAIYCYLRKVKKRRMFPVRAAAS